MARTGPLCFRLPPDLHAAVEDAAAAAGITTSEWIRDMLHRLVYGVPPGIEEGYIQGRQLGMRVLQLTVAEAWKAMPITVDDAMAMLQAGSPGRTPHDG